MRCEAGATLVHQNGDDVIDAVGALGARGSERCLKFIEAPLLPEVVVVEEGEKQSRIEQGIRDLAWKFSVEGDIARVEEGTESGGLERGVRASGGLACAAAGVRNEDVPRLVHLRVRAEG